MDKQEALNKILVPYQDLVTILQEFPEHHDFALGLNHVRTGMLLLKEGIQVVNFDMPAANETKEDEPAKEQ